MFNEFITSFQKTDLWQADVQYQIILTRALDYINTQLKSIPQWASFTYCLKNTRALSYKISGNNTFGMPNTNDYKMYLIITYSSTLSSFKQKTHFTFNKPFDVKTGLQIDLNIIFNI